MEENLDDFFEKTLAAQRYKSVMNDLSSSGIKEAKLSQEVDSVTFRPSGQVTGAI